MKNLLRTELGIAFLSLCILALGLNSCSEDDDLLSQKQITSFVFLKTNNPITSDVTGLVNESEKTITAFVPEGVFLNGLFPTISVSEGATVSPSTEQDFSNPVAYTVTAPDGSTSTYTATVSTVLSQREILQIILDENPGNTLGWDLPGTIDLGTLDGVTTDGSGNITFLFMRDDNLINLVPEIGQLMDLETLNVSRNAITSVPPELGLLNGLTFLELSINNIASLPTEIGNLSNLEFLSLAENQFSAFPEAIVLLTNLSNLFLSANSIQSIPEEIENLSNLTQLYLNDNQLTSLPEEFHTLTDLEELALDDNQLTSVSEDIGRLTKMINLDVSDNSLTSIPPEMGFLIQLSELNIRGNSIALMPTVICALEDHNLLQLSKDPGVVCTAIPTELDVLISLYAANPDNTLGWSVDNYPDVIFLNDGSIRDIGAHNKDLVRIPSLVGQFSSLQVLILSGNELLSVPAGIGDITTLININLQRTGVNTVPSTFGQLSNLTELDLTQNPITSIPSSVCDLQVSNGGILTILTDPGEGCP